MTPSAALLPPTHASLVHHEDRVPQLLVAVARAGAGVPLLAALRHQLVQLQLAAVDGGRLGLQGDHQLAGVLPARDVSLESRNSDR